MAGFALAGIATLSACGSSTDGAPVPGPGQSAPPQVKQGNVVNSDGGQEESAGSVPEADDAGNPGSYTTDPGPVFAPPVAAPAAPPAHQPVVEPPVVEPPRGPKGPFEGPGHVGDKDVLDPGQAEPPVGPKGPFEGPGHVADSGVLEPGQAQPPVVPNPPSGPAGPVIGPAGPVIGP